MRTCPTCGIPLTRILYEGCDVMKCCQCNGHLVTPHALELIRGSSEETMDDLKMEAQTEFRGDTTPRLKCPRCHLPMVKEPIPVPVLKLHSDHCRSCSLVWLDGGELALLQLGYQLTYKSLNAQELQTRMKALEADPDRKARFEESLKNMSAGDEALLAELFAEAEDSVFMSVVRSLIIGK